MVQSEYLLETLQSRLSLRISTPDWMNSTGRTSSLDITLDREVLLLPQEPSHEQMSSEFKTILLGLQKDANVMADQVLFPLQNLIESDINVEDLSGKMMMIIQEDLRERRKNWEEKLQQLQQHQESLDKEFAKLSGNLRRLKTEQLHLRKELSARAQDLEAARRLQEEAEGREAAVLTQLHDSAYKQDDLTSQIDDLEISLRAVRSESEELQRELEETRREQQAAVGGLTSDRRSRELADGDGICEEGWLRIRLRVGGGRTGTRFWRRGSRIRTAHRQVPSERRSVAEDPAASADVSRRPPGEEAQLGYAPSSGNRQC
ncbi:unnamed protein product [Ranitomeya imitator]|uniref:Uncharacterized protein n=1 Tax=Ranitomeya imitator TaxID=111125 RepID=A0ABN9M5G7_9NEOB|nr:unnamed protein product [Ranitomeya imitator]